jgi:hypothetical protein
LVQANAAQPEVVAHAVAMHAGETGVATQVAHWVVMLLVGLIYEGELIFSLEFHVVVD